MMTEKRFSSSQICAFANYGTYNRQTAPEIYRKKLVSDCLIQKFSDSCIDERLVLWKGCLGWRHSEFMHQRQRYMWSRLWYTRKDREIRMVLGIDISH
jgi:hypothetical protein